MNMIQKLNAKKSSKKGFTLMEMLIVVAIIAILVAIAIPTFSSQLKKATDAADQANVRAWYAECLMQNMTDDTALPAAGDSSYTGAALQADGATVTVAGDDADTFKVTYKSNYNKTGVTFPTASAKSAASSSQG